MQALETPRLTIVAVEIAAADQRGKILASVSNNSNRSEEADVMVALTKIYTKTSSQEKCSMRKRFAVMPSDRRVLSRRSAV